jgi:hypothetical protein
MQHMQFMQYMQDPQDLVIHVGVGAGHEDRVLPFYIEHQAVGGFLTHCGWGSTLESVAAGVPMATWPFYAEQFLNEKLIVDVLGIGVSLGVTNPTKGLLTRVTDDDETKPEVGTEQVKALNKLMDAGIDGEDRRSNALGLKAKAKAALEKGGSSHMNMEKLIHFGV